MEFKSFGEIKKFGPVNMTITQKIHGTNAQICVFQKEDGTLDLIAGKRTSWIYSHDDNYGFAAWAERNKEDIIRTLGLGTHHGEWAGPGINSGEGLKEKTFVLFSQDRYLPDETGKIPLPPNTVMVPVLYSGLFCVGAVNEAMQDLKENGSKLAPGFMRTEGVVVSFAGQRFKSVFDKEETQWERKSTPKGDRPKKEFIDFGHLLQPIRLEKLLSRDEVYLREYPKTLPLIVKEYVADLLKEGQISGTDDEIKSVTKGAAGQIFKFIKTVVDGMQSLVIDGIMVNAERTLLKVPQKVNYLSKFGAAHVLVR